MKKPSDDTKYYVTFMALHNDVDSFAASSRFTGIYMDVGTTYYVTVTKIGSTFRLALRTGSHSGTIVWDSGDCTGWNDNYQYLYIPFHKEYAADGAYTIDGYVENLNLQPGTPTPP
ncbi:MAG: hypothetical protein OEY88_00315 [Candidatus Bathyarchaeota archaeon]|nr:hypothetical protein [Candidatus Bathyarchaeota archaeon]